MKKEEIIADIRSYFGFTVFSGYSNYYVGITNAIPLRLFNEHNVSEQNDRVSSSLFLKTSWKHPC